MILNLNGLARQQLDAGRSYLEATVSIANDLALVGGHGRSNTAFVGGTLYRPAYNPDYQSTWADSTGTEYGEADLAARAVLREARIPLDLVRAQVQHEASFSEDPCAVDDAQSFLSVLDEMETSARGTRH